MSFEFNRSGKMAGTETAVRSSCRESKKNDSGFGLRQYLGHLRRTPERAPEKAPIRPGRVKPDISSPHAGTGRDCKSSITYADWCVLPVPGKCYNENELVEQ